MSKNYFKKTCLALNKTLSGLSVGSLLTSAVLMPGCNAPQDVQEVKGTIPINALF